MSEGIVSSYETMAMLSALLAGVSLQAAETDIGDLPLQRLARLFFFLIAFLNLYTTSVLALATFYLHQMHDKQPQHISDFCSHTKSIRNVAQRLSISSVPLLLLAFCMLFLENNPAVAICGLGFSAASTYSLYRMANIFKIFKVNSYPKVDSKKAN